MPNRLLRANELGGKPENRSVSPTVETIFAGVKILLPSARSARSSMIAGWTLVPRKAADAPATDRL
jgi:hypothetical protein